jgi:hypothetical protein
MMAHAPSIPQAALESIARQVGERLSLPGMAALANGEPVEVAESFPVYMLGMDAIESQRGNLSDVVIETGVWHHQIRYGSSAREIARSIQPGANSNEWRVQEVVISPSAEHIDEAIAWIDGHVPGNPTTCLLVVPVFYLVAFWLRQQSGDEIVIADMPERLGELKPFHLYSGVDFLKELAGLPVAGIADQRGIPEPL